MEELLMCSVCIERYHENKRHPVLLPRCGHSFCRPCVSMLVSAGCIVCPTCRTDQRIEYAERLPTEYTLLAIIHAQENTKLETCERHNVKLSFWCRTCSIATCGECLFEDHPTHNHDVIRAAKYISDMKQNAQDIALKFMEVLDDREQEYFKTIFSCTRKISSALRNVGVLRKDMEEARELMKGIKEDESIRAATSLSEAAKFLGLKWNIQDANFQRAILEGQLEDNVELEKKKAQETDAQLMRDLKEQQEDKKEKTKDREAKRLLRKSKTLSSVEMLKEVEQITESSANAKGTADPPKPVDEEGLLPKGEVKAAADDTTQKETLKQPDAKPEDIKPKVVKEVPKQEPISIQDIIRRKEQLKRIDDPLQATAEDAKQLSSKLDKLPDLALIKPRVKFPRIKPIPKKVGGSPTPPTPPTSPTGDKSQHPDGRPLTPPLEEKEQQESAAATSSEPAEAAQASGGNEAEKRLSVESSADGEGENPPRLPTAAAAGLEIDENDVTSTAGAAPATARGPSEVNADSGLSEDSKESIKSKDPLAEDSSQNEGKLTDYIQVPGFMICVESADGRLSSIEWGPQGLHVHCLQFTHVTYDIVIRNTLLNALIPSKSPIVFMELTADQTVLGRVYIKLWGHLRRAHNFLSLCLGDEGKSYMNTKFLQVYNVNGSGERMLGGDYEHNNGRGGKGIIDDLEWNGDYAMPMKAGMITAAGSGQVSTNSLFLICTQSDHSRNFSCPFGLVCEGLKVVKEAVQQTATKQVWITDCGVLIVPPRFQWPKEQ